MAVHELTAAVTGGAALVKVRPWAEVVRNCPPWPDAHPRRKPMALERARSELGYEPGFDIESDLRAYVAEFASGP
jgi:nucleoside-diphosphate-sugar epimerase